MPSPTGSWSASGVSRSETVGILRFFPTCSSHPMPDPDWLDRSAYPFAEHTYDNGHGQMHYVDEGTGPTLLLVHGTPTWSFLYRRIITELRDDYRVVAPDLLGFGLSDKPTTEAVAPPRQAEHLRGLVEHLGLEQFGLIVHDFGGPIGLSLALDRPEAITALVLFNTWMWPRTDAATVWASRFFGTRLGRWVYTRWNFSADVLLPALVHQALPEDVHAQYQHPFPDPESRHATWVCARDLIGANDWYQSLWERRDALRALPALLLWGAEDSGFDRATCRQWERLFDNVEVRLLAGVGHLPQEEAPDAVGEALRSFLSTTTASPA
jgi:haloalkane dehalogenase